MEIYTSLEQIKGRYTGCILALGTFDGVHLGHRLVLHHARQLATEAGKQMVVITFANHPLSVLKPDSSPLLIDDLWSRHQILQQAGVEVLLELKFSQTLADLTAAEFLRLLQMYLLPGILVVGPNNTFGRGGEGTPSYLQQHAAKYGMLAEVCPPLLYGNQIVSSTRIRSLIMSGKLAEANELLGRYFRITGRVIKGEQRGRTIGYPTANVELSQHRLLVADGVYAVQVELAGRKYFGMASIGNNPTFNLSKKRLEVNIFSYQGNAYGQMLAVDFVQYLRGMCTFDGIDSLQKQLKADENKCCEIFCLQ